MGIEEIVERINKKLEKKGLGSIKIRRSQLRLEPTGLPALDDFLGGGIPLGQMIELAGRESAGKSTLALQIAANWVEKGKRVVLIDVERHYSDQYAKRLGLDPESDNFYVITAQKAEEIYNLLLEFSKEGVVDLIIIDSISSLPTAREGEEFEKADVASFPNITTRFLKVITPYLNDNEVTVIVISQVRVNLTQMGAFGERTPGGHALHHKFALSLWLKRKSGTLPAEVSLIVKKSKQGVLEGSEMSMTLTDAGFVDNSWIMELPKKFPEVKVTKNHVKIGKVKVTHRFLSTKIGREKTLELLEKGELEEYLKALKEGA